MFIFIERKITCITEKETKRTQRDGRKKNITVSTATTPSSYVLAFKAYEIRQLIVFQTQNAYFFFLFWRLLQTKKITSQKSQPIGTYSLVIYNRSPFIRCLTFYRIVLINKNLLYILKRCVWTSWELRSVFWLINESYTLFRLVRTEKISSPYTSLFYVIWSVV